MSAPSEDARDIAAWLSVIELPQTDITSRMAVSNLAAFALKKALEVDELKARLEGRVSAPVLRLVTGGQT